MEYNARHSDDAARLGQATTINGLNPLTTYEMRWVSLGYDPGHITLLQTPPIAAYNLM